MSPLQRFLKYTLQYISILPLLYFTVYQTCFSQNVHIVDSLKFIYYNWSADFIYDMWVLTPDQRYCPEGFSYEETHSSNSSSVLQSEEDSDEIINHGYQICVKRASQSSIFYQSLFRGFCRAGERMCYYNGQSVCFNKRYQCPISDVILSKTPQVDGYENVNKQKIGDSYLLVTRDHKLYKPLVHIVLYEFESGPIDDSKVKIQMYYPNIHENEFNLTVLSKDLIYQYSDVLVKTPDTNEVIFPSKNWIYKQPLINIELYCSSEKFNMFDIQYAHSTLLVWISLFLALFKVSYIQIVFLCDVNELRNPIKEFLLCLLTDLLHIYSNYYLRLDYYFALDAMLESGCVDPSGEFQKMKSLITLEYEIIGIALSSLSLLPVFLIGAFIYFQILIIKKVKTYVQSKIKNSKSMVIVQNLKTEQEQITVVSQQTELII